MSAKSTGRRTALAFYLAGPMQSWGCSSKFDFRDTEAFPTKSGVLGLVAAALGIDRNDPDEEKKIAPLRALKMSAFQVPSPYRIGRIVDFQTIGGGYDRKTQAKYVPTTAERKPSQHPVVTRRAYLTDAKFIVVLEGDRHLLERCAAAIRNPRWMLWLGRKSCPLSSPPAPHVARGPQEAANAVTGFLHIPDVDLSKCPAQLEEDADGASFRPDNPISFGKRRYSYRPVLTRRP